MLCVLSSPQEQGGWQGTWTWALAPGTLKLDLVNTGGAAKRSFSCPGPTLPYRLRTGHHLPPRGAAPPVVSCEPV